MKENREESGPRPDPIPAVDAILLDVGGILIDVDFACAFRAWSNASGVPTAEITAKFSFDDAFAAYERGECDGAHYLATLRSSLGLALSDAELLSGWNEIFIGPSPGALDLIGAISKRIPVYLFSNTNRQHHEHWGPLYRELLSPARACFCSYEIGARKPEREAFLRVAGMMGHPPDRIAFFDDHIENIRGARDAGLHAWHVTDLTRLRRVLTDEIHFGTNPETGSGAIQTSF